MVLISFYFYWRKWSTKLPLKREWMSLPHRDCRINENPSKPCFEKKIKNSRMQDITHLEHVAFEHKRL
jgi:hypothetical protein